MCQESVIVAVSVAIAFTLPAVALRALSPGSVSLRKGKPRGHCGRCPAVRSLDRAGCRGAGPVPRSHGGRSAPPSPRLRICPVAGSVPPPGRPERGRNQGPRRQQPRLRWRRLPGRTRPAEWRRQGAVSSPLALGGGEETRSRGRFSVFVTHAGPAGRCGRCGGSLEIPPRRKPASRKKRTKETAGVKSIHLSWCRKRRSRARKDGFRI